MIAIISVIISILALGFSLFAFVDNRRKDQRDLFLKMHQLLIDDDPQRGRYILFQRVSDESSVEDLTDEEWRDINRALATFNALGLYLANKYLRERDVMDVWAQNIRRTWKAAQPYIDYREHQQGYRPWKYFAFLADRAQQDLVRRGIDPDLKVYRRAGEAQK